MPFCGSATVRIVDSAARVVVACFSCGSQGPEYEIEASKIPAKVRALAGWNKRSQLENQK